MSRYIFIGECRSLTAINRGWSWKDGRLAAKPLFEALEAMGVDPSAQEFCNLFTDPPRNHRGKYEPRINHGIVSGLLAIRSNVILVALGQRVSRTLTELDIRHVALVHPAARGKIRKRERYIAHVAKRLAHE